MMIHSVILISVCLCCSARRASCRPESKTMSEAEMIMEVSIASHYVFWNVLGSLLDRNVTLLLWVASRLEQCNTGNKKRNTS